MTVKTQEIKEGWARFKSEGWKWHLIHTSLLPGLMEDSYIRSHGEGFAESVTDGFIDMPGMIMSDRTYMDVFFGEFKLSFPTSELEYFYNELKDVPLRVFSDGRKYYKIHGWMTCVVFTPEQRESAMAKMAKMLPEARVQSEKEHQEFLKRINGINSNGHKVVTAKVPESIPRAHLSGKKNQESN